MYAIRSYYDINDATVYALNIQNDKVSVEVQKYKQLLGEKKAEITKLDVEITRLTDIYHSKTETLSKIYDKKVNYRFVITSYSIHYTKLYEMPHTIKLRHRQP